MEKNVFKESIARDEFNKVFGFLNGTDIFDEFIQVRLGISKRSSGQRSKILAYVTIRSNEDPQFKLKLDEVNKLIDSKLAEYRNDKVDN